MFHAVAGALSGALQAHGHGGNTGHFVGLEHIWVRQIVVQHVRCIIAPDDLAFDDEGWYAEYASCDGFIRVGLQFILDPLLRNSVGDVVDVEAPTGGELTPVGPGYGKETSSECYPNVCLFPYVVVAGGVK